MEKIIDTHSHIYLPEFASDLDDVVARAADAGVGKLLLPNIDSSTAADVLACCDRYPAYCLPMMGLHPTSVKENYREELAFVEKTLDENPGRFVAVGEVGLDLYWDTIFAEQQKEALERQIRMAIDRDLPLSIHCRDAFPDRMVVCGRVASGDQFISTAQQKAIIREKFNPVCVEMEGAAVGHICSLYQKPFVIIRCMSDMADDSGKQTAEFNEETAGHTSAAVVANLVKWLQ